MNRADDPVQVSVCIVLTVRSIGVLCVCTTTGCCRIIIFSPFCVLPGLWLGVLFLCCKVTLIVLKEKVQSF